MTISAAFYLYTVNFVWTEAGVCGSAGRRLVTCNCGRQTSVGSGGAWWNLSVSSDCSGCFHCAVDEKIKWCWIERPPKKYESLSTQLEMAEHIESRTPCNRVRCISPASDEDFLPRQLLICLEMEFHNYRLDRSIKNHSEYTWTGAI